MNHAEIRSRLHDAIGTERYRRFVSETHFSNRLRYWQEQLWEPFARDHSLDLDYTQIQTCFAVCPVHGTELQSDTVSILYGTLAPPTDAERNARESLFPCASVRALGGCVVQAQTKADVPYCPDCRAAYDRWESQAFKRNIISPESPEIRHFLAVKASNFRGDSEPLRMLQYYKTWKPPRQPDDSALADAVTAIAEINRRLLAGERDGITAALATAKIVFNISNVSEDDSIILDHCKMHYIAADVIINT